VNRVLISGASGYFGSLTKDYLQKAGVEVISAGRARDADITFDLDNPDAFASYSIDNDVDVFIHAAATNEVDCIKHPYLSVYRNVAATRSALDFCVHNGIRNFYYISTFHVYGIDAGVVNEDTAPCPTHDYGLTHLQAEEYVRMYTRKGLINGVSFRPANMFDVPISLNGFNRWSLIPFSFCRSAVKESRIVLKSPGYQKRNFVSVKDIVRIINMVFQGEITAEVINIPGVSTLSIREFALLVKSVMQDNFGHSIEIEVPEGISLSTDLLYKSHYFSPVELNFSDIEAHINRFCGALISHA
jgi:UDP-glucose 4-epimerase